MSRPPAVPTSDGREGSQMGDNRLSPDYKERTTRLSAVFPAAAEFLHRLEAQEGGLWLRTAQNAHLYRGSAFLAYLKLSLDLPSLTISPRFNGQIFADTSDESARLFPHPFDDIVSAHGGVVAGWAVRELNGATTLEATTPAAFFDALYAVLQGAEFHRPPLKDAPTATGSATRWEYRRLVLPEPGDTPTWEAWGGDADLGQLGEQGWELVSTTRTTAPASEPRWASSCLLLLFKRRSA